MIYQVIKIIPGKYFLDGDLFSCEKACEYYIEQEKKKPGDMEYGIRCLVANSGRYKMAWEKRVWA